MVPLADTLSFFGVRFSVVGAYIYIAPYRKTRKLFFRGFPYMIRGRAENPKSRQIKSASSRITGAVINFRLFFSGSAFSISRPSSSRAAT